jgi:4-hydroxybenzoate polyprenyltransferase
MSSYPILDVLRILRFPNLVVVAATQLLVFYRVLLPAFQQEGITNVLTSWKLLEIIIITLLITASGYLINDLQDETIDDINRPGANPVARLGRPTVMWFYGICILLAFMISQLLAYRLEERSLLWILPMAVGMLSIYSIGMKRVPVLGNVLVAAYCAGVPGILLLAERNGVRALIASNPELGMNALRVSALFMVFAFVATLLRELVKDLEDIRGDREVGRRTIPVMWGVSLSRKLGIVLGLMVIGAILCPVFLGWPAFLAPPMLGCIVVLILGLLYILFQLSRAKDAPDYHRLSTQLKFFLLGGLGLLAFF